MSRGYTDQNGITYVDSYGKGLQMFTVIAVEEFGDDHRVFHVHGKDDVDAERRVRQFLTEKTPIGERRIVATLHGLISRADWPRREKKP